MVGDNAIERAQVRSLLVESDLPCGVTEAGSGSEALTLLEARCFDGLICDSDVSGIAGMALVDAAIDHGCGTIVVIGPDNAGDAVAALKHGACDYFVKADLNTSALRQALERSFESAEKIQSAQAQASQLEQVSLFDHLTQIANRHLFFDRLEQSILAAKRNDRRLAVFQLDLDLFKEVNDAFGHQTGDELLRVVAKRLQATLRESDTAARLGGDEFAGLLPSTECAEGALVLAERLHKAIVEPVAIGERTLATGASIGLALFPDHGEDAGTLLHAADLAMYDAKRNGADFKIFESNRKSTVLNWQLPQNLNRALALDEFLLHYQPILDLRSGAVLAAEALVRWQHPELGLLPPLEFVPSAERTALIRPLTLTVIEQAVRQAAQWHRQGMPLQLSVNLSASLLHDRAFAADTQAILSRHGLPPGHLTFEVKESGLLTNPETAGSVIGALHELGVTLSIDDFSTGFTSLRYLRDLPISEIKINKLFVDALMFGSKDEAIMKSIIALGQAMSVSVVIEGIEDSNAWEKTLNLGGERGQGFCFSAPLAADGFLSWHQAWQGRQRASFQTDSAMVKALLA